MRVIVSFNEALTIEHALDMALVIKEALQNSSEVVVDLQQIRQADTAGAQIILSARKRLELESRSRLL